MTTDDLVLGYKRLLPTPTGWKSPLYDHEWQGDTTTAGEVPTENNTAGIHALFRPKLSLGYRGALCKVVAFGQVVIGKNGFRAEKATVIDYNPDEREAWLFLLNKNTPTEQKVELAIRCVPLVYTEPSFTTWANDWISRKDRRAEAARAAWTAAKAAAWAATWAAKAAAEAAKAAAEAEVAAWTAAKAAAWTAAWAEAAAATAEAAAAAAAEAAAWAAPDFIPIVEAYKQMRSTR